MPWELVVALVFVDDEKETIWVTIDISGDLSGTAWWTYVLESYK